MRIPVNPLVFGKWYGSHHHGERASDCPMLTDGINTCVSISPVKPFDFEKWHKVQLLLTGEQMLAEGISPAQPLDLGKLYKAQLPSAVKQGFIRTVYAQYAHSGARIDPANQLVLGTWYGGQHLFAGEQQEASPAVKDHQEAQWQTSILMIAFLLVPTVLCAMIAIANSMYLNTEWKNVMQKVLYLGNYMCIYIYIYTCNCPGIEPFALHSSTQCLGTCC